MRYLWIITMLVSASALPTIGQDNLPVIPGLDVAPANTYPNDLYYIALQQYREGDLVNAAVSFDQSLSRTRKDSNGRWIDAIPIYAMLAECLYQAGDLPGAVDNIDAAIALAVRHRGWLGALTWNDLSSATLRQPDMAAAWAAPNIPAIYPMPSRLSIASGDADLLSQARRGGAIESARLTRIDAVEVMRGLATALYRRKIIFGEISGEFEIANQTLEAIRYPKDLDIPIARALIGAMRGCGKFAAGNHEELASDLGQSAVLPGGVHPLTPIILLAGARQMALADEYAAAVPLAIRAAAAASALGQSEWVGEAMAVAAGCVDGNSARQVQLAATGAATAHQRRGRLATVGALAAACDAAMAAGDITSASTLLEQLRAMLSQRDIQQPRWAAYGEYLTAVVASSGGGSMGGETPVVDEAITRLLAFASGNTAGIRRNAGARGRRAASPATPRLYQLALVNADVRGRAAGGKAVEQRMASYIAEPPASVWRNDPVDAVAYLAFDRSAMIEQQIVAAFKRGAPAEVALQSDSLLRSRFLSSLPLGGRVHQIRQIASTDKSLLAPSAIQLLAKPPAKLQAMTGILAAPMPAANTPELIERGRALESLATQLALSRQSFPAVSPRPIVDSKDFERLPTGHGMLTCVDVSGALICTLTVGKESKAWNVANARQLPADIAKLLRGIGAGGRPSGSRLDDEQTWKSEAVSIRRKLIPNDHLPALESIQHLVVVADGPLWYLPFELLPLGDENAALLGDKLAVRYATTPGLAIFPVASVQAERAIGTLSQLFFAPRDGALNARLVERVTVAIERHETIPGEPMLASNQLGQTVGFFSVLGAVTPDPANPFATSLSGYDKNPLTAPLAAWLRFPSNLPTGIFLPGFRTAAGSAQLGSGREIFMTLTALQCAGVRDIVISRWPVGGESTAVLAKEFLQELPFEGVEPAWRRCVQTLRRTTLAPEAEPLLGTKDQQREELLGDHPLFWSGYLLVSPPSPPR